MMQPSRFQKPEGAGDLRFNNMSSTTAKSSQLHTNLRTSLTELPELCLMVGITSNVTQGQKKKKKSDSFELESHDTKCI